MSNNPLKQYFRRPALYFKLPSNGKGYAPGIIDMPENGELPIYPMTAIDEITTRTPDALFNGVAVTEIIRSCVPNIKDPWKILQIDLDALLLAIKIATNGSNMEIETTCPSCEEISKFDVNLSAMLGNYKAGAYNVPLNISDVQVKFKPLDYQKINEASTQQFEVQKALTMIQNMEASDERENQTSMLIGRMQELAMKLVVETIEYIKVPEATVMEKEYIQEYLSNCDKKTYETIRDHTIDLKKSTDTKPLEFKCVHCSHEYQQPFNINVSDFFA
jgi:hypothetical protein